MRDTGLVLAPIGMDAPGESTFDEWLDGFTPESGRRFEHYRRHWDRCHDLAWAHHTWRR